MKVLVDTNVVLDVLLDRKPFSEMSSRVLGEIEKSRVEGVLCATTVTTLDYLLGQTVSRTEARKTLRGLIRLFEIAPVTRAVIEGAFESQVTDFEDAVLVQSGKLLNVDAVVTRNPKDFRKAGLLALEPPEFIALLEKNSAI
jgi:predicted nucleic acid-binding protein